MKRITRIELLRDCGVFRNFRWSSDLQDFERYNLIYGWNGTGKTTLSRLFRNLEHRERPTTGDVTLYVGEEPIKGNGFPQSDFQVRVFNRDFIQDSVFPVGGRGHTTHLCLGKGECRETKRSGRPEGAACRISIETRIR